MKRSKLKEQAYTLATVKEADSYMIEPKTHRMWLTSRDSPREVYKYRLKYYETSLKHFKGKPFEHHFWCNDKSLIPETIKFIKRFEIPVIFHEFSEVLDQFINKKLFLKLLEDRMYSFALDIARQEILLLMGGLYADLSIEQLTDVEWYFKKYSLVHVIKEKQLETHFIAAAKGTHFLLNALTLIAPLMRSVVESSIQIPVGKEHMYLETKTWQLVAVMANMTFMSEAFFMEGHDYRHHGQGSWRDYARKITAQYLSGA